MYEPSPEGDSIFNHYPPRSNRRLRLRPLLWRGALLFVLFFTSVVALWPVMTPPAFAAVNQSRITPNLFDPHSSTTTPLHKTLPQDTHASGKTSAASTTPVRLLHSWQVPMKPATVPLQAAQAMHFMGSDGALQLDLPSTALNTADVAGVVGGSHLKITQLLPPSGSSNSGWISFGTYLIQVVDAADNPHAVAFHQPLTLTFNPGKAGAFQLDHSYLVLNNPAVVSDTAPTAVSTLGAYAVTPLSFNTTAGTLSAQVTLTAASTAASFGTNSSLATFGKPDPFNVNINAGALSWSWPLDLPKGPGGLTPPVTLSYSSESVDEQHSLQGAASWVGEGWSMDLGSISWSEHNVTSCPSGVCTSTWQNSWQLSDPFGTGSEIIPPETDISTYYDDTPYVWYNESTLTYPHPSLQWHTSDESFVKVFSYVGPFALPDNHAHPPCFRAFLPSGIMEEFGCTQDSVQYYPSSGGVTAGRYLVSAWKLDLITDPEGNQIHITYQSNMGSKSNMSYPIDLVPSTIEWDSPGCHNAQSMCTGSSWAPLMRVQFQVSNSVLRPTGAPTTNVCNTTTSMRCDDPLDLSSSGGLAAPLVQSTFALNDVLVQVRSSGTASWNQLRDYQFSYEISGPKTTPDPITGHNLSYAGVFDLTGFQQVGDTGSHSLLYSGMDNSATTSYAYMKVFDVSAQNIVVGPNTTLSY